MKYLKSKLDYMGLFLPALILILWYMASKMGKLPTYIFPSPNQLIHIMSDFIFGTSNLTPYAGTFMANLTVSCLRVFIGFGLAAMIGLLMGFITGRIPIIKRLVDPTINLIRAIPGIGWLPLSMVWFGVGEKTTIFLIALAAFFPIYINTAYGASQVSNLLIRAGKMLGASKLSLFSTVILPASFPSVIVGLRLGMGISWAYLVLGELTGVSRGLGALMMDSRMLGQIEMIPVAMITIAILGKLSDILLLKVCTFIYPYQEGVKNE